MPLKSKKASFPPANPTRKPMSLLRVGTLSVLDFSVRVLVFIERPFASVYTPSKSSICVHIGGTLLAIC